MGRDDVSHGGVKGHAATSDDWSARLRSHLKESIATKERLLSTCEADILAAAQLVTSTFAQSGKVLLCGNGGSAADCQHIAAELVGSLYRERQQPAKAALALTTDTSFITSYANDFGYEGIFARQVEAFGKKGDLLIAISTSGNSANVLAACAVAKSQGMHVVALTGQSGGKLAQNADVCIKVPSTNTQHIQEGHITIGHILCDFAQ